MFSARFQVEVYLKGTALIPNKALGQHFLKDKSAIAKICEPPEQYDVIVEIGPGPGALTTTLNALKKPLYLIEFDRRFEEIYQERL